MAGTPTETPDDDRAAITPFRGAGPGGPRLVPPLVPQHNLPALPTPLIGRERELTAARALLLRDDVRLLTLTGMGGSGKTRLALALAAAALDAFQHGAWFVDLSPIREPGLVLAAVAQALGVRESTGQPLEQALVGHLRHRQLLLLLDNFEHVLEAAPAIAELLAACPEMVVLSTSREPLRLRWEHEYPVPPLELPDVARLPGPNQLGVVPAVAFFAARARAVAPDFTITERNARTVAELCVRLDGLPLALELAAARIRALPPQAILARLERRFELLVTGARDVSPRHRALREALAWSYDLLSAPEQILFRRLSVFAGGWSLDAAEQVCAHEGLGQSEVLDLLTRLVDKSLVLADDGDRHARYRLLETVRYFAADKLREAGEEMTVRDRHLAWFAALGDEAESHTWGPDQVEWFDRADAELDNFRAAFAWGLSEQPDRLPGTAASLRLGWALVRFWETRGYLSEGRRWLLRALGQPAAPSPERARAITAAAYLAHLQGDFAAARELLEEAAAIADAIGDSFIRGLVVQILGAGATAQGDFARATTLLEQPLPTAADVPNPLEYYVLSVASLLWRGELALVGGGYARARGLLQDAVMLGKTHGDRWSQAIGLGMLGHVAMLQADYHPATTLRQEGLRLRVALRDTGGISDCLEGLAWAAAVQGQAERAARLLGAAEGAREQSGFAMSPQHVWWGAERARVMGVTRTSLGEERFGAVFSEGRAMDLELIVEYALTTDAAESTSLPAAAVRSRVKTTVLTPREREVVILVARGFTNRQIAQALVISERTAEAHVERIRGKLGFSTRSQVAVWATHDGLTSSTH